jgi:hypothetical protein
MRVNPRYLKSRRKTIVYYREYLIKREYAIFKNKDNVGED